MLGNPYFDEDVIKRIRTLENFVASAYREAVVTDENGNQKVDTAKLREIIAAETELLNLKRKLAGYDLMYK